MIVLKLDLRRDTYEDYTFPLSKLSDDPKNLRGFELHSLHNFAKFYGIKIYVNTFLNLIGFSILEASIPREKYLAAEQELRTDANSHYHTSIGRATVFEIVATVLVLIVAAVSFLLASASRSDDA